MGIGDSSIIVKWDTWSMSLPTIADRINSYYEAMHEASIGGLESNLIPFPIDHRPCKYCGDDV